MSTGLDHGKSSSGNVLLLRESTDAPTGVAEEGITLSSGAADSEVIFSVVFSLDLVLASG
jgi:hypothetical protein